MKNLTILLTSILVSSSIYALEISKTKTFQEAIQPSIQSTSFSLSMVDKYDTNIENDFQKAIKMADESKICKGGQYSIYPNYTYENNKRVHDGYNSNINFTCQFEDIKKYEDLLTDIKTLKRKLTQNTINYNSSVNEEENAQKNLEQVAFNYAKEYSDNLNNFFSDCSISTINFSQNQPGIRPFRALSQEVGFAKTTTVSAPIKENVIHTIVVNYKFTCK